MQVEINITDIITSKSANGREQRQAYQTVKDAFEPAFLRELLAHTDNNKTHACLIAGFHSSTLNRKLKRHGLYVGKQVNRTGEVYHGK